MRKVAIQGYSGCFHEEAARRFYSSVGEGALRIVECDTFDGLYEAIGRGEADAAVMAIENTVSGGLIEGFVAGGGNGFLDLFSLGVDGLGGSGAVVVGGYLFGGFSGGGILCHHVVEVGKCQQSDY